jgi:protein involved in sex pheromone biosynthesis
MYPLHHSDHFDISSDKLQQKRMLSGVSKDKEAVKKMKEMSKSFYEKIVPTIPNKYRGLTDSKTD